MATASRAAASAANGVSRQIQTVRRRASAAASSLPQTLVEESRVLGRRANALATEAARGVRNHPWAALGVVAAGAALVGGWLFARRR